MITCLNIRLDLIRLRISLELIKFDSNNLPFTLNYAGTHLDFKSFYIYLNNGELYDTPWAILSPPTWMTRPTMNLISDTYCYVRGRNMAFGVLNNYN